MSAQGGAGAARKTGIRAARGEIILMLDGDGTYPAFSTHDPPMVDACRAYADDRGLTAEAFEFQILYGVRRDLQAALRDQGYRVRIYLPFGREWFPYFMRRLGERPANVLFIIRSLLHERRSRPKAMGTPSRPRGK